MAHLQDAPATRRNRDAILAVLRDEFANLSSVLEIGSGTGQHAVYFGRALPGLTWQTSDLAENHDGIGERLEAESPDNVLAPLDLDVTAIERLPRSYDAVFSANTAHIMNVDAVACMFRLVATTLSSGGVFCLYGPFNCDGGFTSESNERFDRALRSQDPAMGLRDVELVQGMATENGLELKRRYMMPANNMLLVFRKPPVTRW